jgi:collagenase-like PrtC family protease
MKLLAPVNGLPSAIKQIAAGADEIYLGGDSGTFNCLSFSGRGRFTPHNQKICPDFAELAEVVQYAHSKKVQVMFAANIPFLADDPSGSQTYLGYFYDYVEQALQCEVDSLIVGDPGAVLLLREQGLKVHLTASAFFETINRAQILFLKELGVNRVVLSYQLVLWEIAELVAYQDLEIEIFGHFGCSFYDDCNLKHTYGEVAAQGIGTPCRNFYRLVNEGQLSLKGQYLNSSLTCSICSLPQLSRMGVYALKLVGRDLDMDQNYQITGIYHQMLQQSTGLTDSDQTGAERYHSYKNSLLPEWWRQTLCRKGLCKYRNNHITRSFVGLHCTGKE